MAEYVKLVDTVKSAEFHKKMLQDEKHWLDRAEEVRAIAETLKEAEPIDIMLRIAKNYDDLAMYAMKIRLAHRYRD